MKDWIVTILFAIPATLGFFGLSILFMKSQSNLWYLGILLLYFSAISILAKRYNRLYPWNRQLFDVAAVVSFMLGSALLIALLLVSL